MHADSSTGWDGQRGDQQPCTYATGRALLGASAGFTRPPSSGDKLDSMEHSGGDQEATQASSHHSASDYEQQQGRHPATPPAPPAKCAADHTGSLLQQVADGIIAASMQQARAMPAHHADDDKGLCLQQLQQQLHNTQLQLQYMQQQHQHACEQLQLKSQQLDASAQRLHATKQQLQDVKISSEAARGALIAECQEFVAAAEQANHDLAAEKGKTAKLLHSLAIAEDAAQSCMRRQLLTFDGECTRKPR